MGKRPEKNWKTTRKFHKAKHSYTQGMLTITKYAFIAIAIILAILALNFGRSKIILTGSQNVSLAFYRYTIQETDITVEYPSNVLARITPTQAEQTLMQNTGLIMQYKIDYTAANLVDVGWTAYDSNNQPAILDDCTIYCRYYGAASTSGGVAFTGPETTKEIKLPKIKTLDGTTLILTEAGTNDTTDAYAKASDYYGEAIDYQGNTSDTKTYRLFYVDFDNKYKDGQGTIYLKADWTVHDTNVSDHANYTTTDIKDLNVITNMNQKWKEAVDANNNNLIDTSEFTSNNANMASWLCSPSQWTNYANVGNNKTGEISYEYLPSGINENYEINYAIGGPSIEMYVDSYNESFNENLATRFNNTDFTYSGYQFSKDNGSTFSTYINDLNNGKNRMYFTPIQGNYHWWLSSPHAHSAACMVCRVNGASLVLSGDAGEELGICPLVSIKPGMISSVNVYKVIANADGGTVQDTTGWIVDSGNEYATKFVKQSTYGTLPTPTKEGYTFDGWYNTTKPLSKSSGTLSTSTQDKYANFSVLDTVVPNTTYYLKMNSAIRNSGDNTEFMTYIYNLTTDSTITRVGQSFGNNISYNITCPSNISTTDDIRILIYYGIPGQEAGMNVDFNNIVISTEDINSQLQYTENTVVSTTGNNSMFARWTPNNYEELNVTTHVKYYETLAQATAGATSGNTIKPLTDTTEATAPTLATGKTVTLDLNDKTVTLNNVTLINYGPLTITGSGKLISTGDIVTIENRGGLIKNGNSTIEGSGRAIVNSYSKVTITDGSITNSTGVGITLQNTGQVELNGGSISGGASGDAIYSASTKNTEANPAVKVISGSINAGSRNTGICTARDTGGIVVIYGGNISGGLGIYMQSGTLIIGQDDGTSPSVSSPIIIGSENGVKINSANFNFYDGIIKGAAGQSILGTVSAMPTNYGVQKTTATENNVTTETAILVPKNYAEYEGTSGAVAKFDAINNNGGNHSSSATTWKAVEGTDGTVNGTATWGDNYLEFDGTSKWVNLGEINSDYQTIEATISTGSVPTSVNSVIGNQESGGAGIYVGSTGKITCEFYINGDYRRVYARSSVVAGTIYNVIATYDGNNIKLYINGQLEGTNSNDNVKGVIAKTRNNTVMVLGGNPVGSSISSTARFTGKIYSAAVYNRGLTADEVAKNSSIALARANNASSPIVPEPVNYYETLATAMSNVTNGNTIKPLSNNRTETTAATLASGKTATLDLNGKEVTLNNVTLTNNGTLTIAGAGTLAGNANVIDNYGTLNTAGNVVISESQPVGIILNKRGGTFNHSGGTIQSTYTEYTGSDEVFAIENAGIFNLEGGTILNNSVSSNNLQCGVLTINSGETYLKSGNITVKGKVAHIGSISVANTPVTISGGTYNGRIGVDNNSASGTITMTGGTFTTEVSTLIIENNGKINMTGGTITSGAIGLYDKGDGQVSVSGGTITGATYGIYNTTTSGIINVTGGIIRGNTNHGIRVYSGTATISGNTTEIIGTSYGVNLENGGSAIVTGGTIRATNGVGFQVNSGCELLLGNNDGTVTSSPTAKPSITGSTYGVCGGGTFHFYDGVVAGQNGEGYAIYSLTVKDPAPGYGISTSTADADGITTETAILMPQSYNLVHVTGENKLTNGSFEDYTIVNAPSKTDNGVTHTWDGNLNGCPDDSTKAYSMTGWGTGSNMGVPVPEIGYHAHMKIVDNNSVLDFKTNETYNGQTGANVSDGVSVVPGTVTTLRWLGASQLMSINDFTAGKEYTITMDVYRVSGNSYIQSGLYYAIETSATRDFYSGKGTFKPSKTGSWETISWTFTVSPDYNRSARPSFYIYGNYGAAGECYVDNVRLEETTSTSKTYNTTYTSAELATPTRTGYTFDGWYNDANYTTKLSTSTVFSNSSASFKSAATAGSNAYIYAKWIKGITLSYDSNFLPNDTYGDLTTKADRWAGNYVTKTVNMVDNPIAEYGKEAQIRVSADNSTNMAGIYAFAGGSMTNGATYQWSVYVKASKNKTLYMGHHGQGEWKEVTTEWQLFTGTFTASNTTNAIVFYQGTDDTWKAGDMLYFHSLDLAQIDSRPVTTVDKAYGTTLGTLPTPTREGYTFQGWYTDPVGGTKITSSTSVPAADTTYYARWSYNPVITTAAGTKVELTKANIANYLGTAIDYKANSSDTNTYRLFYVDFDNKYGDGYGTIYLKADYSTINNMDLTDYIAYSSSDLTVYNKFNKLWTSTHQTLAADNEKASSYLLNPSEWTRFKDTTGKYSSTVNYAVGSPSVDLYVDSYNKAFSTNYKFRSALKGYEYSTDGGNTYSIWGDANTISAEKNGMYSVITQGAFFWWLASPSNSGYGGICLASRNDNNLTASTYDKSRGYCPVISLKPSAPITESN